MSRVGKLLVLWDAQARALRDEADNEHGDPYDQGQWRGRACRAKQDAEQLREALRWFPVSDPPISQDQYLCVTKTNGILVLDWDAISWDHPEHWRADWRYWNAQVTHWRELPEGPKP
ncbi:MAG TPA: hypothetical protein VGK73_11660 [Polyangiaceae bacterium]